MRKSTELKEPHESGCCCAECFTRALGAWIDKLGEKTSPGKWQIFGTITYMTRTYPWQRGFPMMGAGRPSPDFAHHFFERLREHLEQELAARVDYVVADQFGNVNGRFHQHCLLAAPGLAEYSRESIWQWLKDRAGFNRILPFENGAAFYISRYIGRDAHKADWGFRIGDMKSALPVAKQENGKVVLVQSAAVDKNFFHTGLKGRKR